MSLPATSTFGNASPLGELRAAPLRGLGFLVRAWAAAFAVEASLRAVGTKRTLAWIEAVPAARSRKPAVSASLGEKLVSKAYRAHVFGGGCLPRSLVQYLLHRRDGTEARFVIGVRRPARSNLEAHAWVDGASAPAASDLVASDVEGGGFAPIFQSGAAGWSPAAPSATGSFQALDGTGP